jgi:hypothetical protein
MPPYFPSQVVQFLDARFPFARGGKTDLPLLAQDVGPAIGHLVNMIDGIPSHLLPLTGQAAVEFGQSVQALRLALAIWTSGKTEYRIDALPGTNGWHPLGFIRKHLDAIGDEPVATEIDRLVFVSDAALRSGLARDIRAANAAFDHGEWKGAIVLAGSVIEALLLDSLLTYRQQSSLKFEAAARKCHQDEPLEKWVLHALTRVSQELGIVDADTANACDLARSFRNLIHPGRELRTAQPCDRPSAMSALAAMELVIRELS